MYTHIHIHFTGIHWSSVVSKSRMSISFRILITSCAMTAEDCNPSQHA